MKTYTQEELDQIRKTDDQRRVSLVKFAKKFHNEVFSNQSPADLIKVIVKYKRIARMVLRGEY